METAVQRSRRLPKLSGNGQTVDTAMGLRVTPTTVYSVYDELTRTLALNERKSMRKLLVLATMAVLSLTCLEAQASSRRVRTTVSSAAGAGPFSRLMELERRKNAALRQMFVSR